MKQKTKHDNNKQNIDDPSWLNSIKIPIFSTLFV